MTDRVETLIRESEGEFTLLRQDLHRHPELGFETHRTAGIVADKLRGWGYEVETGVGGPGVVATLKRGSGNRSIGLRADMDALPMDEASGKAWASEVPGKMHGCGHDGHTATLLCAAKALAEAGDFSGTLRLVFQPAEEIAAGARRMIDEGFHDRFPVDAIYALHNWPGMAVGQFEFLAGPAMASSDTGLITIRGKGGHGASPHKAVDPVLAAASFIMAVQSVVSRNVDPLDGAVVTVGAIHAGTAGSIIPDEVELMFTLRAYKREVRALLKQRIAEILKCQAESYGCTATLEIRMSVSPVINAPDETAFARQVAEANFGADAVRTGTPVMGGEDFAAFLEDRPGSYFYVGNGDSASLHHPRYDFNDAAIVPTAIYWTRLVEAALRSPDAA